MKKLFLFFTIMLFAASLAFAQWQIDEGFEGGVIPADWTTSTWNVYSTAGFPHTGTYLATSNGGNDWLITPQVYIQSGDSFIFWARAWNGIESFNVNLSTSGNAIGDFTMTLGTNSDVGESWVEYSYDLSSYTGSAYLAIEVISGGDYILALDDVIVGQEPVSCPAPSFLNATNILETSADLGWTENGSATLWNIEVGLPGFTPGTSTYVQAHPGITSNPYSVTGLTAFTAYEFYVQADDGAREISNWAGPEAFSTSYVGVLTTGDIAFTAMNADGDDDFGIVALTDIPANTVIYLTDNEPNAAGTGLENFDEGVIEWVTGGAVISAGTIIVFTDTDSDGNALFGASIGTISVPVYSEDSVRLSTGGDAFYAVEGNPEGNNIGVWLAGIQSEAGNEGDNFNATGLTVGTTFINYYITGSPDGGYYNGDRHQESSFSAYLALLGDNSNWIIESSNGEAILPISTEAFSTFSGPDNPGSFAAIVASISEIDLDWTQNGSNDNVLVAWSSDGTFGVSVNGTTYSAGNPITGGGTVLYYGSDLHFDHTGLIDNTPYYYRAWSYDSSEYSFGITDNATTDYIPYTADFSNNFDSETPPELPDCWSYLEVSASTIGYVETSTTSSYSAPNNVRMYKYYAADDLLLITPQLGDLTSKSNQIRFMARVSGWAQDLIIGTISDPTDETTFHPFQTIPITVWDVYEEYTVMFDECYTLTDEYIAFKHGADTNYSYLNIDDFVYEAIPSIPDPPVATAAITDGTLTFFANWNASTIATGYYLDVATDVGFTTFLSGYENLDVGDVTTYSVTVLSAVNHYYRLRAYNVVGTSSNSNIITVSDSALPVSLSSFTAIQTAQDFAQLNWITQSENALVGYNVYRNTNNELQTALQINNSIIAGTNTMEEQHYTFTDSYVEYEQTYYYWLESVETDLTTEFYGPVYLTINNPDIVELPNATMLSSAYPNPFNPTTTIEFDIKEGEIGTFSIFNVKGQIVVNESYEAGDYTYIWNADDISSGVYFYKLQSESYRQIKKMLLIK